MGTRCQVQVVQAGTGWDEKVTLYHHFDGYPENILGLMRIAYTRFVVMRTKAAGAEADRAWEGGRAGKAASFLCSVDPGQFEPEEGHERHGDIEYWYTLTVQNHQQGSIGEMPTWSVEIEYIYRKKKLTYQVEPLTKEQLDRVGSNGYDESIVPKKYHS